ncbi:MAG: cytochrome b/b6 domain-containing protein [Cellvibrionaceae bacterium]
MPQDKTNEKQRIWDLPTRIFHWSLVVCIGYSWWSAEYGELIWHQRCGYILLALIIFRILWGFWGSSTSRFGHFLHGPKTVFNYIKTLFIKSPSNAKENPQTEYPIGHNPLGGWSVIVLLLVILGQILLGLFSEDVDGLDSGPLSYLVSYDVGRWAAKTHEALFDVLIILIGIHIFAAFFYLFYKHTNLIKPMFTGKISSPTNTTSESLVFRPLWIAILTLVASSIFVWWLVN